jgi:competence protein ComEA
MLRIRKININTITFDKLRLMPYLDYKQVNAIIEYRKQHGDFTSIADIEKHCHYR